MIFYRLVNQTLKKQRYMNRQPNIDFGMWDLDHGHFFLLSSAACFDRIFIHSSNCLNQCLNTSEWLWYILAGRSRTVARVRVQRRLALQSRGTWCRGSRCATGPAGSVCLLGWGLSWLSSARLAPISMHYTSVISPICPLKPPWACLIGAASLLRARQTRSHEPQRWWLIIVPPQHPECDKWECKLGNLVQSEFFSSSAVHTVVFPGFTLFSKMLQRIYFLILSSFAWFSVLLLFSSEKEIVP